MDIKKNSIDTKTDCVDVDMLSAVLKYKERRLC
jgi:hypothetical protein